MRSFKLHPWSLAAGGTLGLTLGAGAMLVAFPFLFPPTTLDEPAPQVAPASLQSPLSSVASAAVTAPMTAVQARAPAQHERAFQFDETAPGRDPIHWANGSGRLLHTADGWVLRLESNFEAGPGPNFWLYLNTRGVGDERDFRADGGRVKLTQLRSFRGAQNYRLPADFDPSRWHTVTIWCETFGVYIGSGALQSPASLGGAAPGTTAASVALR